MEHLDSARHQAHNLPDGPATEVTWKAKTGKRGRPKQQFDPVWLAQVSSLHKNAGLAPVVGCSAQTLRRCKLKYKLATAGCLSLSV
jgi:hypothetical protein